MVQRRAARWTLRNFDHQASVTEMINKIGWRTLEQRRADGRLCLFYKIVYGLVAVPLPDHVQYSHRISRYCHSMTFRQVYNSRDYYKYSFYPLDIVQWNALPNLLYVYINAHLNDLPVKFSVCVNEGQDKLPTMYWLPKLHKRPYKARFIANSSSCTTTELSKLLTSCLTAIKSHVIRLQIKIGFGQ